jgi:hypothetical protein
MVLVCMFLSHKWPNYCHTNVLYDWIRVCFTSVVIVCPHYTVYTNDLASDFELNRQVMVMSSSVWSFEFECKPWHSTFSILYMSCSFHRFI